MAMRITNNMIMKNSIKNINTTKTNVDKLNNQMTSQKKIDRASEDPVVAIRSLRLRNTQSQVDQYLEKNISDANSWLQATEEALENMKTTINSAVTELDSITGTLSLSDKQTKLQNLQALREEFYSEGNADLTNRLSYEQSDEVGQLVKNFNAFMDRMQAIIKEMQTSKDDLRSYGERLSSNIVANMFLQGVRMNSRDFIRTEIGRAHV